MDDERITVHGKQIMLDGEHLADARDDTAAEIIGIALTNIGLPISKIAVADGAKLEDFFA